MNNTIDTLNTLFLVCIILAGIFLVLSVILFFIFDIRSIFNIRTGRAKKKTVQEMQSANSRTDVLKISKTGQRTRRGSLTGPLGTAPTSKRLRHSVEITPPPQPQRVEAPPAIPETDVLTPETSVLCEEPADVPETSVLKTNNTPKRDYPNFKVIKHLVLINTEEVVP